MKLDDSDLDDMVNKKDDQSDYEFDELVEKQIKTLLESDIEDLDVEHDFDQEMKILTQDKIKKLVTELSELFHMAEDSRVIIEDYDEYMALLKDYLRQVDDLKAALKKYPKLANLIAILMNLSYRIEKAQDLATKKEQEKVNIVREQKKSKTIAEQKVESNQNLKNTENKKNLDNKLLFPENKPHTGRPLRGMLGDKNVAFTPIDYLRDKKNSPDIEFAKLNKNGQIIFDNDNKNIENKPVKNNQKPIKKQKKNTPRVEKVFTSKDQENNINTKKISPSEQQRRLDAYNKDVAARAKGSSGPNQMTR